MKGGWDGGFYSGKFSTAASGFILKYWLKRRTAYLRGGTRREEQSQRLDKNVRDMLARWIPMQKYQTV